MIQENHRELEVFRTPSRVYEDFFAFRKRFWTNARIFDPSAGDGRMIRYLKEQGNRQSCHLSDIRQSESTSWSKNKLLRTQCTQSVGDFLKSRVQNTLREQDKFDGAVTNPPFSLSIPFVEKMLRHVVDGGQVCILQKLQWLGTQNRSGWLKYIAPIKTTLVIPYRICWEIDERPENKADNCEYAWFCFEKGYKGRNTVDWLL